MADHDYKDMSCRILTVVIVCVCVCDCDLYGHLYMYNYVVNLSSSRYQHFLAVITYCTLYKVGYCFFSSRERGYCSLDAP